MQASPGRVFIDEPCEVIRLDKEHFPELIRECHELTSILVHVMLDRARHFTSHDFHDEKMRSLGRLAAGLAHELNNPASAVVRGAKALLVSLDEVEAADRALGDACLAPAALEADRPRPRHALGRRDDDPAIARRARRPRRSVGALARGARCRGAEHRRARAIERRARAARRARHCARREARRLSVALRALAASRATRQLAWQVETGASRIHELVSAVKGFTHLDQAAVPAPVPIAQGLQDTLAVLGSKAKAKSITLTLESGRRSAARRWASAASSIRCGRTCSTTPSTRRRSTATSRSSRRATATARTSVVRVIDDGPGIPAAIRRRDLRSVLHDEAARRGHGARASTSPAGSSAATTARSSSTRGRAAPSSASRLPAARPIMTKPVILRRRRRPRSARRDRARSRAVPRSATASSRAASASEALETVRELKQRGAPVALFLVDQRMPEMTGTELLVEARKLYPDARARPAHRVRRHRGGDRRHQRGRPRSLPDEAVGSAGAAALSGARRPAGRVDRRACACRSRASASSGRAGRRRAMPRASSCRATRCRTSGSTSTRTRRRASWCSRSPASRRSCRSCCFPDGTHLVAPTTARAGGRRSACRRAAKRPFYDVVIIGGGPAGLANAVYAASEGLRRAADRAERAGRAGGHELADRELPRLSRRASPARTSRSARSRRRGASAPSCSSARRSSASAARIRTASSQLVERARRSRATRSCIATGMAVRELDVPGHRRRCSAPASTTARR